MILTLFLALLYILGICIIGYAALQIAAWAGVTIPPPIVILFKAFVALVCLAILAQAVTGSLGLDLPGLHRLR